MALLKELFWEFSLGYSSFLLQKKHFWITLDQVSANRGPDSTFTVKANTKTMCPKSSRFPLVTMMDRGRVIQPRVKY